MNSVRLSAILDENLPVDYEGFLGIESNVDSKAIDKRKTIHVKKNKVKTCQIVSSGNNQHRESAGSVKTATTSKRQYGVPFVERNTTPPNKMSDDEYGLLDDLIKRVRNMEKCQNITNKRLRTEIETLNRRVAEAEYRNVVMDIEIQMLKNQLIDNSNSIQRMTQKEERLTPLVQQKYTGKRILRDREQTLSKEEIGCLPVNKHLRPFGHQRLRSAGFETSSNNRKPLAC